MDLDDYLQKFKEEEEEDIAKKLANLNGLKYFNLKIKHPNPEALAEIDKNIALKLKIIAIDKKGNNLIIGAVNPLNPEVKKFFDSLKNKGYIIEIGVISLSSFNKAIEDYKFIKKDKPKYTQILEIDKEKVNEIISKISQKEDLDKIIKENINKNILSILDYILAGAIKFESSDIHLEPAEDKAYVKLRIDGILYEVASFDLKFYKIIKNRIKLFSGLFLNITERPQDGRFSISLGGKIIDIRVSTIPSSYDETIVMRLLDVEKVLIKLEELGLDDYEIKVIDYYIHQPNGLILNTGPTGSGKTTTLYAILNRIKRKEIKIITIEDPIEYKIEGITQTQVNIAENYTFASGLRSILRQDPDVILVGEIRDKDTAEIAINASLTGHLVLSTLHTNSSLGAVPRLIDLGVDKSLLPPSLRLVIAQRLVRKVCQFCQQEFKPDHNLKNIIKNNLKTIPQEIFSTIDFDNLILIKANGCEKCLFTGYKGRIAIFELLKINPNIEKIIYINPTEESILNEAIKSDFITLQQSGILKAIKKITTLDEVERVTGSLLNI
jgi:type II secretory ATPase GspE/PulE/Tfp pilus assembly ATPase PilB-like protein